MSILVDWEIRDLASTGLISPFNEDQLNSQSYNITLADQFGQIIPLEAVWFGEYDYCVDPVNPQSFKTDWCTQPCYWLSPRGTILAGTTEKVKFPEDVVAEVKGRSSLGRLGLLVCCHAGYVDGGFAADTIVLEITNVSDYRIKLTKGMKIAQLVFQRTELPEKSYKDRGRYQGQGFQGSLGV